MTTTIKKTSTAGLERKLCKNGIIPATLPVEPGIWFETATKLEFVVQHDGHRFFHLRVRVHGRDVRKTWKAKHGLAKVREQVKQWEGKIFNGEDPRDEVKAARGKTLAEYAAKVIPNLIAGMNDREESKWRTALASVPTLTDKSIGITTTAHVQAALAPIFQASPDKAFRVRVRLQKLYAAAKGDGLCKTNPALWEDMEAKFGRARVLRKRNRKRRPALDAAGLPALMMALAADTSIPSYCLQFIAFTALRSQEARTIEWSFIDMDAGTCTVPRENMKDKDKTDANDDPLPHVVPLAPQVLAMLRAMPNFQVGKYVFPTFQPGRQVTDTVSLDALLDLLHKHAPDACVHGMRATFTSYVNDTYQSDLNMFLLAELAQDRAIRGPVAARYIRLTPKLEAEKRRPLMTAWANYARPANVVQLRTAA